MFLILAFNSFKNRILQIRLSVLGQVPYKQSPKWIFLCKWFIKEVREAGDIVRMLEHE